ncbi:MAG: FtsQ-type POTRA domain-containing protein [Candidatus Sungbacteria bacterium]|nr:FtsQ-type POTRA domain-containing protein [bacterium]MDZ4260594.1 FtsQ-type POTRA domain-containing protein [Candidatus Sungbacteria bacterium]
MNNRILYIPKERKSFKVHKNTFHLRAIIGGAIVCIIIAAGIISTRLDMLRIHNISVRGTRSLGTEDIQRQASTTLEGYYFAGLVPYRFLLASPVQTISSDLKDAFPLIADVAIKKVFPDELDITVRERNLFGILCNDRTRGSSPDEHIDVQCAYVDTDGIAYQRSPISSGFLITKISTDASSTPIGVLLIEQAVIERMMLLKRELPAVAGIQAVSYELMSAIPHEIRVVTNEGFALIVKDNDDAGNIMRVLATVLEKEIGARRKHLAYIDLRFGNKVFYKFK